MKEGEKGDQYNQQLEEFAINNEFCGYFRTSAKTGLNINESMEFLIRNIIKRLSEIKVEDIWCNVRNGEDWEKQLKFHLENEKKNDKSEEVKKRCC